MTSTDVLLLFIAFTLADVLAFARTPSWYRNVWWAYLPCGGFAIWFFWRRFNNLDR